MSLAAKYKGKCKNCGSKFEQGATIHNEYGFWCTNKDCGKPDAKPAAQTAPKVEPPKPEYTTDVLPFENIHNQVLAFAKIQANQFFEGRASPDQKSIDILTQVFYKKNMDYMIHRGNK